MRARLRRTIVVMVGLLTFSILPTLSLASSASASESLIEVTPALTTVKVPAPGHSSDWTMKVTNVSDRELELSLEVFGPGGPALEGPHPLELSLTGSDQIVYADQAALAELLNRNIAIPAIDPGESFVMNGTAALPRAAGDEYRTASADVKFRFVAQAEDAVVPRPPDPEVIIDFGPVAITGSEAILIGIVASVLLALGLTIMAARKRGKRRGAK